MSAPYTIEKSMLEGECRLEELFEYVKTEAGFSDADQIEKGIKSRLVKIGLAAVKAYYAAKGTGDVGETIQKEDGTILKKENGYRERVLFTTFGKITIPRTCYRTEGQPGIMPLDAQANLPDRSYSYLLQEYMDLLAIQSPFGQSSNILDKFLGFKLHSGRIEVISQNSSVSYDQFYDAKPLPDLETEGEIVVASFDGVEVDPKVKTKIH